MYNANIKNYVLIEDLINHYDVKEVLLNLKTNVIPDVLPNDQQKNKPEVYVKIHCGSLATDVEKFVILPLKEVIIESEWNQQQRKFINQISIKLLNKFISLLNGILSFI